MLGVLTDDSVGWWVGAAVALAGVFALGVAMLALWLLRDREKHFSGRVNEHAEALGLGNLNRTSKRHSRHPLEWKGWVVWEVVLAAFLVADLFALICTRV